MQGNCTDDLNPDYWFPELRRGGGNASYYQSVADKIQYALDKCATCPIKQQCYEMGMDKRNEATGIWGGTTAGERLFSKGYKVGQFRQNSSLKGQAIHMETVIRPYLRSKDEKIVVSSDSSIRAIHN